MIEIRWKGKDQLEPVTQRGKDPGIEACKIRMERWCQDDGAAYRYGNDTRHMGLCVQALKNLMHGAPVVDSICLAHLWGAMM